MRINASIPIHRGMEKLDKDAFRKSIDVLAAEVAPATTHNLLKAPEMRGYVLLGAVRCLCVDLAV